VTAVPVGGVCDVEGSCSGCAVARGALPFGTETWLLVALALGLTITRRSRR
jgi:hypothetical protein